MNSIASAPEWLVRACQRSASPKSKRKRPKEAAGAFMDNGRRNADLMSMAGSLRAKGLNPRVIRVALGAANDNAAEPLSEEEVDGIAASVMRYEPYNVLTLTQQGFGRLLAEEVVGKALYCTAWGWMSYTAGCWRRDLKELVILDQAKGLALKVMEEAEKQAQGDAENASSLRKKARTFQNRAFLKGAIDLAAAEPQLRVEADQFDANTSLFNLLNGTLDLTTLKLQPHSPADFLTKVAQVRYEETAVSPLFDGFLARVLSDEVGRFLLRAIGYAMLGSGSEQKLLTLIGTGRNGKSTFVNAILPVFGGYAVNVEPKTFSAAGNNATRNDLARLVGARLVTTSEFGNGVVLDAALIKKLTGGDTLSARFLFQEYFEFTGRFLPILGTNYAPVLEGSDAAMARRQIMVRFGTVLPVEEVDPMLPTKLNAERSGILNRVLQGLADYRSVGLAVPDCVQEITQKYLDSANLFAQFLEDECELGVGYEAEALWLYQSYKWWCERQGVNSASNPVFKRTLQDHFGLEHKRKAAGFFWLGVRMKVRRPGLN
jgi:putative DNA primase/helicase